MGIWLLIRTGPILEIKGMGAIFSKKTAKNVEKAKYLKILTKSENILKKGRWHVTAFV